CLGAPACRADRSRSLLPLAGRRNKAYTLCSCLAPSTMRGPPVAKFSYAHIHLRSPNPEATAAFYEHMFDAEVIRTMQQGKPRIDLKVGGANVLILPVVPGGRTAPAPKSPSPRRRH